MCVCVVVHGEFFAFLRTRFINMQSLESSASVNCLDFVAEAVAVVEEGCRGKGTLLGSLRLHCEQFCLL